MTTDGEHGHTHTQNKHRRPEERESERKTAEHKSNCKTMELIYENWRAQEFDCYRSMQRPLTRPIDSECICAD